MVWWIDEVWWVDKMWCGGWMKCGVMDEVWYGG